MENHEVESKATIESISKIRLKRIKLRGIQQDQEKKKNKKKQPRAWVNNNTKKT